jgi:uncharacterized protein YutE (UPF0331/DUF86 family)
MKYDTALLEADIRDELHRLDQLSREYGKISDLFSRPDSEVSFFDKAAVGYFLHSFYNGCENIFQQIARFFENDISRNSWHRDLLKRMKLEIPGYRPRCIDEELYLLLNEYRAFRHVFRHSYSFQLDWEREKAIAEKFPRVWKELRRQVEDFLEQVRAVDQQ